MKTTTKIALALFAILLIAGGMLAAHLLSARTGTVFKKSDYGNPQNPLYGKVFRIIDGHGDYIFQKDIPELENWRYWGGCCNINYFWDDKNNVVVFLVDFESLDSGKVQYRILDTINIGQINYRMNEAFCVCRCSQGDEDQCAIFAIAIEEEDKEYYDRIVKAWRINLETGRIEPITNLEGIKCLNNDIV